MKNEPPLCKIGVSLFLSLLALSQFLPPKTILIKSAKAQENPILERIAKCESGGKQFDKNGKVIRGEINPADIGKWQLNWDAHSSTIREMGINIYTEEGNKQYAEYLLRTRGTRPWKYSKKCWDS